MPKESGFFKRALTPSRSIRLKGSLLNTLARTLTQWMMTKSLLMSKLFQAQRRVPKDQRTSSQRHPRRSKLAQTKLSRPRGTRSTSKSWGLAKRKRFWPRPWFLKSSKWLSLISEMVNLAQSTTREQTTVMGLKMETKINTRFHTKTKRTILKSDHLSWKVSTVLKKIILFEC